MSAETRLTGPVQVARLPNGDRDIVCVHAPEAATAIHIPAEAVAELRDGLAMDEQEMQQAQARQNAASRLVVPAGRVNGSNGHR